MYEKLRVLINYLKNDETSPAEATNCDQNSTLDWVLRSDGNF